MSENVDTQWVEFQGGRFRAEYPVREVSVSGDKVFVIYDWMAFPRGVPAKNLFAYDLTGKRLWIAEDIGMGAKDAYVGIGALTPLMVYNYAGFACTFDEETGRVLSTLFTK